MDNKENTKSSDSSTTDVNSTDSTTIRDRMDEPNKKAYDILMTGNTNEFLREVFTRPDGTHRSYAEMRYMYG